MPLNRMNLLRFYIARFAMRVAIATARLAIIASRKHYRETRVDRDDYGAIDRLDRKEKDFLLLFLFLSISSCFFLRSPLPSAPKRSLARLIVRAGAARSRFTRRSAPRARARAMLLLNKSVLGSVLRFVTERPRYVSVRGLKVSLES